MHSWPWIRKALLWLLAAIGSTSLISKLIEKWAEKQGYLDDPSKGLQWLVSVLAAVSDLPFFYPAVAFLAGLTLGVWLDWLIRLRSDEALRESKACGKALLEFERKATARHKQEDYGPDETRLGRVLVSRYPEMRSLFLRVNKTGVWAPSELQVERLNDLAELQHYLRYVGQLLADGHLKEARQFAKREGQDVWEERIAETPLDVDALFKTWRR